MTWTPMRCSACGSVESCEHFPDLITWLRAQLDDDERVVRAATAGPWRYDPTGHHRMPGTVRFEEGVFTGPSGADALCVAVTGETDDPQSMADAEQIARWNPARALAEIEAKRAQVSLAETMLQPVPVPPGFPSQVQTVETWVEQAEKRAATLLLKLLALPYADRPGFRGEWRL